jgi:glutamyl-Q tRNA(Asp) synthetase
MNSVDRYCGRFAPSPTGPLHFGSLVAAVGSYLESRRRRGAWLVRIEDLDRPREVSGAAAGILRTLETFGLCWYGEVMYQSQREDAYRAAFERLRLSGEVYACGCSRREIEDSAIPGIEGPVYPGTCRDGLPSGRAARGWRVRVTDVPIAFEDRVQGAIVANLARDVGDFIVRRADNLYAYQLAVVVDDAAQGVTDVVRGADLLASTARQIHLYRLLGLDAPSYAHLPVIRNGSGEKLSKQTGAMPLDPRQAPALLWRALDVLGQRPPAELRQDSVEAIRAWAESEWKMERVPREVGAAVVHHGN